MVEALGCNSELVKERTFQVAFQDVEFVHELWINLFSKKRLRMDLTCEQV